MFDIAERAVMAARAANGAGGRKCGVPAAAGSR